ncbi:MAG TPA: hypothetical protein VFD59_10805 [Nocardioidaceae bacterium]|nr:hypothetical protein [Nocardioidaceae bacterium]
MRAPAPRSPGYADREPVTRYLQLVVACTVLGTGVAFLLEGDLGSDGYSSLVNGLTLTTGLPFWVLNIVVGAAFIAMAWLRGTRPGPGTVVQWFLLGPAVDLLRRRGPGLERRAATRGGCWGGQSAASLALWTVCTRYAAGGASVTPALQVELNRLNYFDRLRRTADHRTVPRLRKSKPTPATSAGLDGGMTWLARSAST